MTDPCTPKQCPGCGAWTGEWCDQSCPTCDQSRAGFEAEQRGEPFPPCVLGHPRAPHTVQGVTDG